jgi:sigma-B regulation protein RsbU (phosphoserine phosphatase)
MTTKWRLAALAIGIGLFVLVVGRWVESVVIAAVRADGHKLEWISDVVASVAITTMTYLWLNLRAARTRVVDMERARIALDEQLRLAAEIQRTLLPEIPRVTPGYLWAARMVPAHEIGGDFYDFITRDDGAVLVIVGDVSGKGIPAALHQSTLKTLFRMHASMTAAPEVIASRMSKGLREETGGLPYATAILARLDRSPRRITYVNAGHPPGLLLRGADILKLDAGGPPLGLLSEATYDPALLDLHPGDFGVLVTDGITEALEGIPLTLSEALKDGNLSSSTTPEEGCEYLLRIASRAPGPPGAGTWHDDKTALAFRVCDES